MARALIPNSTQVPDLILDYWMPKLSGSEFKVLMYLCRRTYGFGKATILAALTNGVVLIFACGSSLQVFVDAIRVTDPESAALIAAQTA